MKKLGSVLSLLVLVISIVAPFGGLKVHALGDFEEDGIVYELQEDDSYAVIECNSNAEKAIIPSEVNGKEVTKIKSFNNFTGKEVELPGTIKEIEDEAFSYKTSLSKINLPDGLSAIRKRTFYCCMGLKTVNIPRTVTEIGEDAFSCCDSLEELTLPEGLKTIGEGAFSGSSLREMSIPNTVEEISQRAFSGCRLLEKIDLPKGLEVIKQGTFSDCYRLKTVKLEDNIKSIEESAFYRCYLLKSITIPNKTENIDRSAFIYCPILKDISVSDENRNFKVLEDGSLFDNNKNEVIVHINKKDLEEKEKMADAVYAKLKDFMVPGISFEELNERITEFMQTRGGGKPEVLPKESFDREVLEKNKMILYRGVIGRQYLNQIKTDEKAFFSVGGGNSGNGIYTTNSKLYAEECAKGAGSSDIMNMYIKAGKENSFLMRMYLKDDAKVISNKDIEIIRHIIVLKHSDEFPISELFTSQSSDASVTRGDQFNNMTLIANKGLMAYILGFDAIDCLNNDSDCAFQCFCEEMVVVNRSKLVVCDEEILI